MENSKNVYLKLSVWNNPINLVLLEDSAAIENDADGNGSLRRIQQQF